MRRPIVLLISFLLISSCGDDDAITTTSGLSTTTMITTTTPVTTTTTTTVPETTTTTTAPTTTTLVHLVDPDDLFPAVFPGANDAHGSGCVTGQDTLPDGVWFGFVTAKSGGTLSFDLACFFTGPAGVAAATADGEVGYDLDFYIRNQNPRTYPVVLDTSRTAWRIDASGGGAEPVPVSAASWPVAGGYVPCPGPYCAVWLYVNNGLATGLVEQYLP